MSEYTGQFRYPAVQRYLQDSTIGIGEHLENITMSLSIFIEVGVPTIQFAQKHGATNLQNLSTVATLFSAVTATTVQYSFDATNNTIENAVNAFWFASLVLSIASAVNSEQSVRPYRVAFDSLIGLLGLTWKQAI
jgi:WD repeat-containing protein 26